MASDYAKISADNIAKYGTEVSYYGSDFADRYTERTHFIFELLQNAEDALRWRVEAEPGTEFPHNGTFRLFPDRLEVSQPQFTSAQQLKDRYWLYVVENPGTPSQIIHRIQNPAVLVQCFAYDQGWRALAEPDVSPAPQG
jgi:hypothetical protein